MSFLDVAGKKYVVFGLANKKSVASAIARTLVAEGAELIHVVRSEERRTTARKLFPDSLVFLCDVEDEANIIRVRDEIAAHCTTRPKLVVGIIHSQVPQVIHLPRSKAKVNVVRVE